MPIGFKGFQFGQIPHGAGLINSRKKNCKCGKLYSHVYVDSSGQKHRWCLPCANDNRRKRRRKKGRTIDKGGRWGPADRIGRF
jgi:hypothetical protein